VASPALSDWCDLIDTFDRRADGHKAIVAYLRKEHGVDDW
jgi:hypothetical protein